MNIARCRYRTHHELAELFAEDQRLDSIFGETSTFEAAWVHGLFYVLLMWPEDVLAKSLIFLSQCRVTKDYES